MCLATFIRTSTFHRTNESSFAICDNTSMQHNTYTKILALQKIKTFTRLVCYAFFTFHPQIIILFVLRDVFIHPKGGYVHDPSIKDKRVTKFYFDPFGWPEDGSIPAEAVSST